MMYQFLLNRLVETYNYRKLPIKMSEEVQAYFKNQVQQLNLDASQPIYSLKGECLSKAFNRVVIGDYGAYIEFEEPCTIFEVKKDQYFRCLPDFKGKYVWLHPKNEEDCKVYYQLRPVCYADYQVGCYYVGIYDIFQDNGKTKQLQ